MSLETAFLIIGLGGVAIIFGQVVAICIQRAERRAKLSEFERALIERAQRKLRGRQ